MGAADFDAIFYHGEHGPMWNLFNNEDPVALVQNLWSAGKPFVKIRYFPSVLLNVKDEKGESLLKGKRVIGTTNSNEALQLIK